MAARERVHDQVLAGLPDLGDEVDDHICAEIPVCAALSPDQLGEVSAIARWAVQRVLDIWVAAEEMDSDDVRRFRGISNVRALDGRPLTGVLRAYWLAGRRITDVVAATAGDDLTARDALALARVWMSAL